MSTFDGIVQEFPFIQIDYFRKNPERPPPLACFLSHVHSDHLQGLESLRAPFIYCSAATRELLLRIEKYPHRMNFNNGILESRRLDYKHLAKLLRPIPLNTPTDIDLTPRLSIRVTLLDANHCTGAVMFLIEGDGKAILYTGDIRAETWWVNSLIRHPILLPYTLGSKRLDKIYLDTTFAQASHAFSVFPSKAEGVAELLRKIEPYPEDTTFYFRAWTFGYEEVWMALSAALTSKIHVDRYQLGLYKPLSSTIGEGSGLSGIPYLCGFELGNRIIPGVLTGDETSRIHSCEPGVRCAALQSTNTVYIVPIVSRTDDGSNMPEVGAGGGRGDLYQIHELELPDQSALERLEQLCRERIHDPRALSKARQAILDAFKSNNRALSLDSYGMNDAHDIPLEELVNILSRGRPKKQLELQENLEESTESRAQTGNPLPRTIHFPYSRHSSYTELCELVSAFKPKDIHPCTVDPLTWNENISIENLFGHICSGNQFSHDEYMRDITAGDDKHRSRKRPRYDVEYSTQSTQQSSGITDSDGVSQSFIQYDLEKKSNIKPDKFIPNTDINSLAAPAKSLPSSSARDGHIIQNESRVDTSSLPSSEITQLSSSEAIQGPNHTANEFFYIPQSTPETAKARRNTIREAWNTLKDAQSTNEFFHLGSLPSSWPTDESRDHIHDHVDSNADQEPRIQLDEGNKLHPHTLIPAITSNPSPDANRNPNSGNPIVTESSEMNMDLDTDGSDDPVHLSSQLSDTLSISSSAFASQTQGLPCQMDDDDNDDPIDDYAALSENHIPNSTHGTVARASLRARRAAYIAARADNYDSWAAISLVSAGNNHTEEEIEL